MINWTDAAIEAANKYLNEQWAAGIPGNIMRAALDAAVKAQGCPKLPDCKTYADRAYSEGRANALDEAAAILDEEAEGGLDPRMARIAAAIRALKEKKK